MKKILLMAVASIMAISASAQEMVKKVRLYKGNEIVAEQKYDDIDSIVFVDVEVPVPGALSGKFSVSAGKQVQFSQGNLQYQASTSTWRFAENQYDTIGAANDNISSTYDGWIDFFGWGTGANPTLASTSDADYATFTDWGVNKISNGGDEADMWRTLTKNEWKYLFFTRANAAILFAFGSVNGVNGLIILPDNWTLPEGASFTASTTQGLESNGQYYKNDIGNNYSDNSYTVEQWAVMESAGAVFLPAAGCRTGTHAWGIGEDAFYFSTNLFNNNPQTVYFLTFQSNSLNPNGIVGGSRGASVRLVR